MSAKPERDLLGLLPDAAAKVKRAAEESIIAARRARANARRDRMNSQQGFRMHTIPPAEPLDMPEGWSDDEDTARFILDGPQRKKA